MKKSLFIIALVLICQSGIAQYPYYGKNDLEKMNLKGKVASVAEYYCVVKEAFGEWEKGDRVLSRYSVFNKDGNFFIDTQESMPFFKSKTEYFSDLGSIPVPTMIQWYYRDENNVNITNIKRFTSQDYIKGIKDIETWISKASDKEEIKYDYNSNGSVKSVTLETESGIKRKDIYKYNDNGYEIWFYKKDGTRDSDMIYYVLKKERAIVKHDVHTGASTEVYNESGKMVQSAHSLRGVNGEIKGDVFYGYNKQGDVETKASSFNGSKSIKGLESLYPLLGETMKDGSARYFGYEYDANGNWIVRKEYGLRNNEVVVLTWKERDIVYETNDVTGSRIADGILKARKAAEEKARAKEEWSSLPDVSSLSEPFIGWLESKLSWPDASTALCSILTVGSLTLDCYFKVDKSGKIKLPVYIYHDSYVLRGTPGIYWQLYNYSPDPSAEKKESKAKEEIEAMLKNLISELPEAPQGNRGKWYEGISHISVKFSDEIIRVTMMN